MTRQTGLKIPKNLKGRRLRSFGVTLLALLPHLAWADMPLTMEDLVTDKGKFKLDLSLAYANLGRNGVSTAEPITVQIGPTSFITLPTLIGDSVGNSDTIVTSLGLRYGLSAKAEIYGRLSGLTSKQRYSGLGRSDKSSESGFVDAWVGINYQFRGDKDTPALLGFAEIALSEKHASSNARFKSAMLGISTYKAIDPVVFSLTAAYRYNRSRHDGDTSYQPGNLFLLNPGVAFAVNDCVTLTTDVQWTRRAASRLDGSTQDTTHTATDVLLGIGYGFSRDNTLNITFKINASGRNGSELRGSWLYTF
jgi:hypothetical protein